MRGWSVAAISADLVISISTSRMHLRHLHAKAGTNSLHALAMWALAHSECCVEERLPSIHGADADNDIARFQSLLLDSMAQALIATDTEDRVTAWNAHAEQLYGWSEEEALGRPIYELTVPATSEQTAREIMETLSRGDPWTGEFVVTRRDGSTFLALVQNVPMMRNGTYAGVIGLSSDITEQRLLERSLRELRHDKALADDQIRRLAYYDDLTGLPNRALLQERLEEAMTAARRSGEKVAVHFLDLDGFDDVTSAFGDAAADELVRLVAGRLAATVRPADTLARLCSGEFVVVEVGLRGAEDAARTAERLLATVKPTFEIDGEPRYLTACCGVAVYPDHAHHPADLYAAAHSAMQATRDKGCDRYKFFKPAFAADARERTELAGQLRRAINDEEIQVVFQPIIRAADGAVTAVETLARFTSPTRGPVGPDVFIPIAESSGLIVPLSHQVNALAFGWLRRWQDAGHDLSVNLNVSPLVFRHDEFEDRLQAAAAAYQIQPSRVTLEITESVLMDETEPTVELLRRLRGAGYRIAVDDFGAGFSMLASLRSPGLTSLKLDRAFIADLEGDERSQALVRFAIGVGHALGLTVVAEGVETEDQYQLLREEGVDECQGFLFARPIPGEQVASFLETSTTRRPG